MNYAVARSGVVEQRSSVGSVRGVKESAKTRATPAGTVFWEAARLRAASRFLGVNGSEPPAAELETQFP